MHLETQAPVGKKLAKFCSQHHRLLGTVPRFHLLGDVGAEGGQAGHLGVQRGVYLGESHRRGIRSERVEDVYKDRILDGANLQSAEVFQFGDRALAIAGMPETDFLWWSSFFGHINRLLFCRFTLESVG